MLEFTSTLRQPLPVSNPTMSTHTKILVLALGTIAIIWGNLPSGTFYPGGLGILNRDRPIPRWFGRLWFSLFGLWLIYMAIAGFTPLIVERVILLGLGAAIIASGLVTRSKSQPASAEASLGISSEPKPFGGLLFIVVGVAFIVGGLLLTR